MNPTRPYRPECAGPPCRGLTLIELLVVVGIVAILSAVAVINFQQAQIRARVAVGKQNLVTVATGLECYRIDYNRYPLPVSNFPGDPYGVVASTALRSLTTPIAYVGASGFRDPFGTRRVQFIPGASLAADDPFRPPTIEFNPTNSLLYFYYPSIAMLVNAQALNVPAFSVISSGPDMKDSFIAYYPFPAHLPDAARALGVTTAADTVYDPTNGTMSGGDLAAFGGPVPAPRIVGGQ